MTKRLQQLDKAETKPRAKNEARCPDGASNWLAENLRWTEAGMHEANETKKKNE
jgi:hypothetical protein